MTFWEFLLNHLELVPSAGLYGLAGVAALLCFGAALGGRTDP